MFFYIFISTLEFMLIGLISLLNYKQLQLISLITTKLNDISDNMPTIKSEHESEDEDESTDEDESNEEDESDDEDENNEENEEGNIDISDIDILKHMFQQNTDYGNVINSLTQMLEESSKKNKIS